MKRSYRLGAHKTTLVTKPKLKEPNQCGVAKWEEKEVEVRTTNAGNGKPYDLASFLVVFFHEYFHMVDLMQGTELFNDKDPEMDYQKETTLDSFCEGFVQFMLDNKMLRPEWVKGCREMLKKVKAIEVSDGQEQTVGDGS
jgi:predicted RNA-binding protein with PUA domain